MLVLERAAGNQEGLQYCFYLHINSIQMDKGSYCFMQLGPPSLLEECMS